MRRPYAWATSTLAVAGAAFIYGMLVAQHHIFPFSLIDAAHHRIASLAGRSPRNVADTAAGARIYAGRCAACHGRDASGGRGPNLRTSTRLLNEPHVFDSIVRRGIAGTEMPAHPLTGTEMHSVRAYLLSLAHAPRRAPVAGDPERGVEIVRGAGRCLTCHRIGGNGGALGPDLSTIGARRGPDFLARSLIDPSADIGRGYRSVHVVTGSGDSVTARLLSETAYSLRMLDAGQRLRSFLKSDLSSVELQPTSLMPSYRGTLDSAQVADVVAYLASLGGGSAPSSPSSAPPVARGADSGGSGAASSRRASVTYARLLRGTADGEGWPTFSGSYDAQRYSPLAQITRANVSRLALRWARQLPTRDGVEATPLVSGGVMYVTWPPGGVGALDVRTGQWYWKFERNLTVTPSLCCGRPNRGVALLGDRVYVGTLDAHLLALDAATGALIWDTQVAPADSGYSITGAPLAVKDMILTGVAGGEYGVRGFVDAYDARTGERRWRFHTVPAPGERGNDSWAGDSWKHGGGPTWMTGSFDPTLDLVYWGVGNPGPDWNGDVRQGDNLYTNAVVALDPDDGTLRWYFQFTPHDEHDWDATQAPVQATVPWHGRPRRVLAWANRNGFYYLLDRATGEFLLASEFAKQTWAERIDSTGRPVLRAGSAPTHEGSRVAPTGVGATNWWPPSYSPQTGLFYVTAQDGTTRYHRGEVRPPRPGAWYAGSAAVEELVERAAVRAIDAATGRIRWEYPLTLVSPEVTEGSTYTTFSHSGLLSTAGGLVFGGTNSGSFFALDASTGRELWRRNLGGPVVMGPVTYTFDGEQRVTVIAGNAVITFAVTH
ncbi:MAG TPA: PQQ-dependent dehydrogenase, methanol/ethanol family [Gemmatimonadaceae bacterium]|nr:PQQ-dependent dehydrogenase, methanol/ethanol family [Gemmatimonadaceae bacterium]